MKLMKKQHIPSNVKDFVVGERYVADGLTYEIVKVNEDSVDCRLNKVIKHFPKVLYCGVMAAMKLDRPLFLSSKIVPGDENEFETRQYHKRAQHG